MDKIRTKAWKSILLKTGVLSACTFTLAYNQPAFAMSGPAAIQIDGGPLGELQLSGGADGLFYGLTGTQSYRDSGGLNAPSTNNAGPKSTGALGMNALTELQKTTGILQATIELGTTNIFYMGLPPTPPSIQSFSTGPLYAGYLTIAPPNLPITISIGQMTGVEGFEATQDWNNANIFLSLLGYVQTGQSRGVDLNYTKGPISAQLFFSDGYDTGVFNFLEAVASYTFNPNNEVAFYYGGNLGKTGLNANTYGSGSLPYSESHVGGAPQYANSQMFGAYYDLTIGQANIVPEVQYQYAKQDYSLGITKAMSNIQAGVFANYSFGKSPYSIGAFVTYFDQHESALDASNGLYWFIGPNASGEQFSVTPTWQYKYLFARADLGLMLLNNTSAYGLSRYGYGNQHDATMQFTGLMEGGVLF